MNYSRCLACTATANIGLSWTATGHIIDYAGDRAVLTFVHPVVIIRKNYVVNMKLRQESIRLTKGCQPNVDKNSVKDRPQRPVCCH